MEKHTSGYLDGKAKGRLRFNIGDRVSCSKGAWEPRVHGTVFELWGPGDAAYGIICDDGAMLKAPRDEDNFIFKLSDVNNERDAVHEEALFQKPPPLDDCPICMQGTDSMVDNACHLYCCGQLICIDCFRQCQIASQGPTTCPFCREKTMTRKDAIRRLQARAGMGNADACNSLALMNDRGSNGIEKNPKEAHRLWTKAAELGSMNGHYQLWDSYSIKYAERGVEKDTKKAIYHLEMAAIKGDGRSRCHLGFYEADMGNWDRAKKHWSLSAGMGCDTCMEMIKSGYLKGAVTKDEYSETLRSHVEAKDSLKSKQRDAAHFKVARVNELLQEFALAQELCKTTLQ